MALEMCVVGTREESIACKMSKEPGLVKIE